MNYKTFSFTFQVLSLFNFLVRSINQVTCRIILFSAAVSFFVPLQNIVPSMPKATSTDNTEKPLLILLEPLRRKKVNLFKPSDTHLLFDCITFFLC